MSGILNKFKKPEFTNNDLILYFHPYNFFSQKVLVILNERKINFTPYIIDLSNGEQYSTWFLNINPKANVPVLQDGCFIIPDSTHIINYLEVKYQKDQNIRLIPKDSSPEILKQVNFYETLFARLPIGAISLGSFIHDDLKLIPKAPFIGPARKACLINNDKVNSILKSSLNEDNNISTGTLNKKLQYQDRRREIVYNRAEFQKLLDALESILKHINNTLGLNPNQEWLCSSTITIADITLGLLLYRLYTLGFEHYFWTNGKLPYIETFLKKFKELESFKKSVPTSITILKDTWNMTPSNYKIGAGVLGMAMFAASAFVHK